MRRHSFGTAAIHQRFPKKSRKFPGVLGLSESPQRIPPSCLAPAYPPPGVSGLFPVRVSSPQLRLQHHILDLHRRVVLPRSFSSSFMRIALMVSR